MPELQQPTGRIPQIVSLVVLVIGALIWVGWQFDIAWLKAAVPDGTVTLNANTAVCFVLAGLALHHLAKEVRASKEKIGQQTQSIIFSASCFLLIGLGLLSLGESSLGWNLGVDRLFAQLVSDQNSPIGLASEGVAHALSFVLIGAALLLLNRRQQQTIWIGQLLTLIVLMLALPNLIGSAYNVQLFDQVNASVAPVVLNPAVVWVMLSSGILFLYPTAGVMQPLTAQLNGGLVARELLPLVLVLPFGLGWIVLQGYRAGYYDAEFGLLLLVVLLITLETGLIWRTADLLNRNHLKQKPPEPQFYQSETCFRRLFDSNIIGVIFADFSGNITEANDAFLTMMGYMRAELLAGKICWQAMTPPEYQAQDHQSIAELKQFGACTPYEKEYFRKDGSRVPILVGSALLPESENQAICFVLDLSARKQAELAMHRSAERYQSLVSAFTSIVWASNAEGAFVELQPGWAAYTGQSWENYQGYGWAEAIHPDDREEVLALWTQARHQKLLYQAEGRIWYEACEQYRYFEARAVPLLNPDGTVREWVGTLTDVHDRKQAVAALRESEARFRQMTDTAPVPVWMSGTDKLCDYFNRAWLNFRGRTMQQELGNGWAEGIHPDDVQRYLNTHATAFDQRQPFEMEYRLQRFDGEYRWVFDVGVPRFTAQGDFVGYIGSCIDIHDRKQAEADIQQLNDILESRVKERTAQLEAANQELEAFSYSVSHDLQAPLRHIAGFVDLLQKRLDRIGLDAASQRYLTIITETTRQAGVLIDELLAFSRMGRTEMRLMLVDMNQLVREIQQELEPETAHRQIHWQIERLPMVRADLSMLRLVVRNLVENAVKYTRSRAEAKIEIGSSSREREEVFFVRDNGIGFNMQYGHKLFSIFQRLHSDLHYEGTGIGLANVRRIIHRHGGQTWAEGKVNAGATFYFSLPKQTVEPHALHSAPQPPSSGGI